MSERYAPESLPTWTIISRHCGQYPAFPAPLSIARPATPATYVPWFPALVVASVVWFRTFQVDEICPSKSARPDGLIPVSRIAITVEGAPRVMSHACVVWVTYHPQAPPPRFHAPELRKYGSFGRTSWAFRTESRSAKATDEAALSRPSAPADSAVGAVTTWTPSAWIARTDVTPARASTAAAAECETAGLNLTRRRARAPVEEVASLAAEAEQRATARSVTAKLSRKRRGRP